jgi:hypothetical protein
LMVSACGGQGPTGADTRLHFAQGHLILSRAGLPDAEVTPRGSVQVGGWDVPVNADARVHLVRYHTAVLRLIDHAGATHADNEEIKLAALAEALKTAPTPNPESTDGATRVTTDRLCQDLVSIRSIEQEITSRVPDLAPYSVAASTPVDACTSRESAVTSS